MQITGVPSLEGLNRPETLVNPTVQPLQWDDPAMSSGGTTVIRTHAHDVCENLRNPLVFFKKKL